ncbi:MAG TPA: ATP-binding protein [Gemmatimonadales bacterium]|nr:ATP-binding protein [Gemmatimonadales bacterium]
MTTGAVLSTHDLAQRLAEAEATIEALLSGQIDAVVDSKTQTPVLLSKAQAALRESNEKFHQLADNITDVFWIRSPDLREVQYVSPAYERIWGRPVEPLYADPQKWMEYILPEDRDRVATAFAILTGDGPSVDLEYRIARPDGEIRWVRSRGFQVRDAAGVLIRLIGIITDTTEPRRLQAQLMVSDRMASVGTLAAGVAHEINNPLAAVIANLEFVAESLGSMGSQPSATWLLEEIKEPLEEAREGAQRVRLIVRDLKIFSRSPADEPSDAVDVKAIMESSARMAWNEIRHRARLVKDYGVVPAVRANEARLGQVFLNLLINAAQAIPEGRAEHHEIRVSTRLAGERVIVEVGDTGAGIPPEIIGRVFDAFFTTKPIGVGTGLGLAICHRIVTNQGGELTVESELGRGTTFRVALLVADEAESKEPVPVKPAPVVGRRGRILVVDDEELVLHGVKRMLWKEHDVVVVPAATAALALCASGEKFDVILCDLMMPDMTGMDFHGELSRIAPEMVDRVIFMTGGAFTARAQQFLSTTSTEHIEKPFHAANLRAMIQRYLR